MSDHYDIACEVCGSYHHYTENHDKVIKKLKEQGCTDLLKYFVPLKSAKK